MHREAGAGSQFVFVDRDEAAEGDIVRVVMAAGGETRPRHDPGLPGDIPLVGAQDADHAVAAWSAVHDSRRSTGQVLTIRPGSTPHRTARSHPFTCQSSWPGACASVSMENTQPTSTASRSSRFGGSRRSGRELISTATPNRAQAAKTTSASNSDGGRPR